MKIINFVVFFLSGLFSFAQLHTVADTSITIESTVFDGTSMKPVPYCKVYNLSGRGALTNQDGYFKFENVSVNDTVIISFIGYYKKIIPVNQFNQLDSLFLYPSAINLNEIIVLSDYNFLYDLVSNCKKTETNQALLAKTYFALNSTINGQQVELIEAYYNGLFVGYNIENLSLKTGRIALAVNEQRLFISTETSTAINMQRLFKDNILFPKSPLTIKKSELKKQYHLQTSAFFIDDQFRKIYVIDFLPKDTSGNYFSGTIWIDSTSNFIHKIKYKIIDAKTHPFSMIAGSGILLRTDFEITKNFTERNGKMYFNSMDFNYVVTYKRRGDDLEQTVSTNSVLYAYSYKDNFTLPFFEFTDAMYGDYMKIFASPYNDFFWRNINEFKLSDYKNKNDNFYLANKDNKTITHLFNSSDANKQQFEKPYIQWSEKRIVFKEDLQDGIATKNIGTIPTELYNLKAQLYLDVNLYHDTLDFLTTTIFDPYKTFYYFPINNLSLAFINIYFDLMEIQRRTLNQELQENSNNVNLISTIYANRIKQADQLSQAYFKETERGTNYKALLKWNNFVRDKLNIDNLTIFEISTEN